MAEGFSAEASRGTNSHCRPMGVLIFVRKLELLTGRSAPSVPLLRAASSQLEDLTLDNGGAWLTLIGTVDLPVPNLQRLKLHDTATAHPLLPLSDKHFSDCVNLTEIEFRDLPVRSLVALSSARRLRKLSLSSQSLPSLHGVRNMPWIEHFCITSWYHTCEWSHVGQLTRLTSLVFPRPLDRLLPHCPISQLVSLRVTHSARADERACCQHLASAVSLTSLGEIPMRTVEFARAIGQLPRLTTLRLCGATDEVFREFCTFHSQRRPVLEVLHFRHSSFSTGVDESEFTQIPLIAKITSLRELSLTAPRLHVSQELCELPNLEYLELFVREAQLDIGQCPKLRQLRIRRVRDCDLGNIATSKSLVIVQDFCGVFSVAQLLFMLQRIPTLCYLEYMITVDEVLKEEGRRRRVQVVDPNRRT